MGGTPCKGVGGTCASDTPLPPVGARGQVALCHVPGQRLLTLPPADWRSPLSEGSRECVDREGRLWRQSPFSSRKSASSSTPFSGALITANETVRPCARRVQYG